MRFLLLAVLCFVIIPSCSGKVKFKNGALEDLTIFIHDTVAYDPKFPEDLFVLLSNASSTLYIATKGGVHIRTANVLIPATFGMKPDGLANDQTPRSADIVVANGSWPTVVQPGGCGDQGKHISVAPEFIKKKPSTTPLKERFWSGKRLAQALVKYRYGVFRESARMMSPRIDKYEDFYPAEVNGQTKFLPTMCGNLSFVMRRWNGSDCEIVNNWIDPDCTFSLDDKQQINSSFMFTAIHNDIVEFCEDTGPNAHNVYALNAQNDKCNYQSIWSVLKQHSDFKDFKPVTGYQNGRPNDLVIKYFKRSKQQRIVYVLDTSRSLRGCPLAHVVQAAMASIMSLPLPIEMGIVKFSFEARTQLKLTTMKTLAHLMDALVYLPSDADGLTCIKCGMQEALKELKADNGRTNGSTIVLLSDGEENVGKIEEIMPEIIRAGVIVNTVATNAEASEHLADISTRTGGRSFYVPNICSGDLHLVGSMLDASRSPNEVLAITKAIFTPTKHGATTEGFFIIDSTIGHRLRIIILYDRNNTGVQFEIIDTSGFQLVINPAENTRPGRNAYTVARPNGEEIHIYRDPGLIILTMDAAPVGVWQYVIRKTKGPSSGSSNGSISILSQPADGHAVQFSPFTADGHAIQLSPFPSTLTLDASVSNRMVIYAYLHRGPLAVLKANVQALVEGESTLVTLSLRDDGQGADNSAHDGVYTAEFIDFVPKKELVRYCVLVIAEDGPDTQYAFPNKSSTGRFERDANSLFEVINADQVAPLAPARVKDFAVESIEVSSRKVKFIWTVPGGNGDSGDLKLYDLAVSGNSRELIPIVSDKAKILQLDRSQLDPERPGRKQVFTLDKNEPGALYARIRGVNYQGLKGEWSNLASTLITAPPPEPTTTAPTRTTVTPALTTRPVTTVTPASSSFPPQRTPQTHPPSDVDKRLLELLMHLIDRAKLSMEVPLKDVCDICKQTC